MAEEGKQETESEGAEKKAMQNHHDLFVGLSRKGELSEEDKPQLIKHANKLLRKVEKDEKIKTKIEVLNVEQAIKEILT